MPKTRKKFDIYYRLPSTPEEHQEYYKCRKDPFYFMEKYVQIDIPILGRQPFKLNKKQKELIKNFLKYHYLILRKSRQIGITTVTRALALWLTLFYPEYSVGVVSKNKGSASKFIEKTKRMIHYLPPFLVRKPTTWNKQSIGFDNGSSIIAAPASANTLRGETMNLLVIDEAGHTPYIDSFWKSAIFTTVMNESELVKKLKKQYGDKLAPYGALILSNGVKLYGNANVLLDRAAQWYAEMWKKSVKEWQENPEKAKKEGTFFPMYIHWSEIEYYTKENYYDKMVSEVDNDEEAILTEIEGQIIDIAEKDDTFLPPLVIKQLRQIVLEKYHKTPFIFNNISFWISPDILVEDQIPLVIGIDTAAGGGDNFSIQIINAYTGEQVGEFAQPVGRKFVLQHVLNATFFLKFWSILKLIVIERNNGGIETAKDLDDLIVLLTQKYQLEEKEMSILYRQEDGKIGITTGNNRTMLLNIIYDTLVKIEMPEEISSEKVLELKPTLSNSKLIKSLDLVNEFAEFKRKRNKYQGKHDDRIMSLAMAYFGRKYLIDNQLIQVPIDYLNQEEKVDVTDWQNATLPPEYQQKLDEMGTFIYLDYPDFDNLPVEWKIKIIKDKLTQYLENYRGK